MATPDIGSKEWFEAMNNQVLRDSVYDPERVLTILQDVFQAGVDHGWYQELDKSSQYAGYDEDYESDRLTKDKEEE